MKLLGAKHEKVEVGPRGSGGTEQETTPSAGLWETQLSPACGPAQCLGAMCWAPPFSFQTRKPGPVAKGHGDQHGHDRLRMWSTNPHGHPQTTQAWRVQLRRSRPSGELLENTYCGGKALWEQLREEPSKGPGDLSSREPDSPPWPLGALVGRTPRLEAADANPFWMFHLPALKLLKWKSFKAPRALAKPEASATS